MSIHREPLFIANIGSKDADAAWSFHERLASIPDSHLWARTETQIRTLIDDQCLFGVWAGDDRELVGLCYAVLDETGAESWEVGGLSIHPDLNERGIGTVLVRFAIAHTIVFQQPFNNAQGIIAHVHEANSKPRGILEKLGFVFSRRIEVPESAKPPAFMKRNAEGKVVGDEFYFPIESVSALADWFETGKYDETSYQVEFGLGQTTLDDFLEALKGIGKPS